MRLGIMRQPSTREGLGLMSRHLEALRKAVEQGRAIVLVGAGVASAMTANDPRATWTGLLASGVEYASARNSTEDVLWRERMQRAMGNARAADDYLAIASQLVARLGGAEGAEMKDWLRDDIGGLRIVDGSLATALQRLEAPLVTTNYDSLLERALNRQAVTWKHGAAFQNVISRGSNEIVHLHGHWIDPTSIVLTAEQYELMLSDRETEVLRQSMAAVNTLVYVGFGDGMDDPAFTKLREWVVATFTTSATRHYRLCLAREVDTYAASHNGERIVPIAYGTRFEDLAAFIGGLAPSERAGVLVRPAAIASENILESIRERVVLADHIARVDEASLDQLMIPPVLLPMPQEQFVRAVRNGEGDRPTRCAIDEEVSHPRLLVCGEEHVGVSTSLLWLASRVQREHPDLIPIAIDYLKVGAGLTPLRKLVRHALRSMGIATTETGPMPAIILALDNVHTGRPKELGRVIEELAEQHYAHVLIGCRSGAEMELSSMLASVPGVAFRLRYVGRLARRDVEAMARLLDGRRTSALAEKAVDLVRAHKLPSTPFTFSMVLSALMRGESLLAATSPTTLLDAYVEALLGRGTALDDARYGMSSANRAYVLGVLAELFVSRHLGSVPQLDVVSRLTDVFNELDWVESPVDVVKDLQARRILVIRGGSVSFSQTSYLHLFAAKHAQQDASFMMALVEAPLHYAPILAHYAALQRNDVDLLRRLMPLLDQLFDDSVPLARAWGRRQRDDQNGVGDPDARLANEVAAIPGPEDELAPIDEEDDSDLEPFPLLPAEDMPSFMRMATTLGLLSNLLRDTEVIRDQSLRLDVLQKLLFGWARFADYIEADPAFKDMSRDVARDLAESSRVNPKHLDRFIDDFTTFLPIAMALGGVTGTLASQKLTRPIERGLRDGDFRDDVKLALLGTFLLAEVRVPGWASHLERLRQVHSGRPVTDDILRRVLLVLYTQHVVEPKDEAAVEEFLMAQTLEESYPNDAKQQHLAKARLTQSMRSARLKAKVIVKTRPSNDELL